MAGIFITHATGRVTAFAYNVAVEEADVMETFRDAWVTLKQKEPWWAEFWSAVVTVGWGLSALQSPDDLDKWPSMNFLLRLAPDCFWVSASLFLGAFQIIVLLMDSRWLRWAAALAMAWFWSVMVLGVWQAVPWSPATMLYGIWLIINSFSILRLPFVRA